MSVAATAPASAPTAALARAARPRTPAPARAARGFLPRPALRASRVVAAGFFDDDGSGSALADAQFDDAQYAERRAEDAIKLAVKRWSDFDDAAQPFIDHDVILRERERELDEARRDALRSSEAAAERVREAEAAAALWEGRAKEVRADLELTQRRLQELQEPRRRLEEFEEFEESGRHL